MDLDRPSPRLFLESRFNLSRFSAAIRSLSPFRTDTPRLLFEAKAGEYDGTAPVRGWEVSADGQRFLLLRSNASLDKPVTAMNVVLNWAEALKRLVPAK
jgi:hypothetical protein